MSSNERPEIGPEDQSLHLAVYRVVRDNIEDRVLLPGMLLGESSLAAQFAISRVPVARALRALAAEGLVHKVPGSGFRVAGLAGQQVEETPHLVIPPSVQELAHGRAGWSRIYEQVERELVACMPFGRYKIVELTMAEFHGVSRTVTRDLLARLEERGLIERAGRSQCFLPELTPQLMRDLYEVRRLLEPAALRSAFPLIEPATLFAMRDALVDAESRYPDVGIEELDRFETDLHVRIVDSSLNRRLIAALRASQLPLLATNYLLKHYLGAPSEEPFLGEHRLIVELLIQGAPDAAASALEAHLLSALGKGLSRLAALRASHQPDAPPYLQPINEHRRARR